MYMVGLDLHFRSVTRAMGPCCMFVYQEIWTVFGIIKLWYTNIILISNTFISLYTILYRYPKYTTIGHIPSGCWFFLIQVRYIHMFVCSVYFQGTSFTLEQHTAFTEFTVPLAKVDMTIFSSELKPWQKHIPKVKIGQIQATKTSNLP